MFCPRCASEVADTANSCTSCGMDLSAITEIAKRKSGAQADEFTIVQDALRGEYEVLEELGRGGMAIVFKARDLNLDREVAVKVLPLSMAYDQEFVQRFQREAKTAAKLEHPHVIPIYRVGKTGRVIFFVMKYLRGGSLNDVIEARGAIPPGDIRRILMESADALGYAHENGIVHRDIKPDNIVFDEKGRTIVTDFGIAKAATGTKLTGTGMAIGTPYYMSPEQARAQDLDGRSDIYSLGVVAYQCLTGRVPFEGDDSFAVGIKHISEPLPMPELETEEQRDMFQVVMKMLEKDPNDRFQTTAELAAALGGVTTTQQVPPVDLGKTTAAPDLMATTPAAFVAAATPTTPLPSTAAAPGTATKKLNPVVMAIIGLVAIGGGGAAVMSLTGGEGAAPPDPVAMTTDSTAARQDSIAEAEPTRDSVAATTETPPEPDTATRDETADPEPEPEPERTPPPDPRLTAWQSTVASQARSFASELSDQGFRAIGSPIIANLPHGDRREHTVTLLENREYVIVGTCESGPCDDLDLRAVDAAGRELDSDYALDARPVLQFFTRETEQYSVVASMPGCSDRSGCYYSVSFFARDVEEQPRQIKRN